MNTIQLNHFALDRPTYEIRLASGFYAAAHPGLSIEEDPDKSYDHFIDRIRRVNPALQWDKQWKIRDRAAVEAKLADPGVKLYRLMDGATEIGFAVVKPPAQSLKDRFFSAATGQKVIEIDYLALFAGHEGKGRGKAFFEMFFADLFKDYDAVYWSQKTSNAPTLADFYKTRMGMMLLASDDLPDFRLS